ncbi:BREX system P-loop protein BrxC [Natroniella acetigena]|uniref:BREX system P-loop protein BrxC n=1 Tax=Natroniella acetigena TaxID=52004 RepID=UPI002009DBFA|nr:BREX system P-loop protein BrxC [Natroniella acetigena]MCK8827429.1 BREX system P-loop protein BrxC [Natroniella acetigena]
MRIEEMFYKDIHRDIKGVIKVGQDDEENIKQELEEYVVTNELAEHFEGFYKSYQKGIGDLTDKMGVWVSGFFGSGKSHFIKILSYLLENKMVDGKKAVDFFEDKTIDEETLRLMEDAGEVSTDVILFNIDSKSDSDSKSQKDAIVTVFMKVFNEMQGFCSSIPWLAELERSMVKDGTYQDFKAEFERIAGGKWEERRNDLYFEAEAVIQTLAKTTRMSEETARKWYDSAEDNYSLSVERFAQQINEYIEEQGGDHHLIFLVDEIGQYIGDDTQLMLNLQTVVEDLGTYCGGKAWVLVTSQQDMDSITEVKGSDFSKIQGRFDTRLSLSSANVDEVIKKRILLKADTAKETLKILYNDQEAVLKNLITFSSDTGEMKSYQGADDFAQVYPFIPYQFDLLQKVFEEVRLHGATGKHLSEGERSLLSAFQESAQVYAGNDLNKLVPFSTFYNSIESFLDSTVSRVIKKAEQNSRLEEQDVEILKVLFMIRYIDEVPANVENITTLMISDINEDKLALKEKIEDSLAKLSREALIQKNGPEYMFLTNEEQDINREIKSTSIDPSRVVKKISEIAFESIYSDRKYSYSSEYNFAFNKLIDDQARGRQQEEIGVQILTPYSNYVDASAEELKLKSGTENKIIIKLPKESELIEEVEMALKISSYIKKKSGTAKNEVVQDILNKRNREVHERQKRIKKLLEEDLGQAEIYVIGEKLEIKSNDPVERINRSFEMLINSIYSKLNYIEEFTKSESELAERLKEENIKVNLSNERPNQLAIDEIRRYIENQNARNRKVTMKDLVDKFNSTPQGWKELDIAAIVVDLLKEQEIKLVYNGEIIDDNHRRLVNYLTKARYKEKLIVNKRRQVEQRLINGAKMLARDLFRNSNLPADEDGLMDEFQRLAFNEQNYIKEALLDNYKGFSKDECEVYPGENVLKGYSRLLKDISDIQDAFEFYNELAEKEDELLDYEEEVARVKNFFETQKKHYDAALRTLRIYQKDKDSINDQEATELIEELKEILTSDEPYGKIHLIPDLRDKFHNRLLELLAKESEPIAEKINESQKRVIAELEEYNLLDKLEDKVKQDCNQLLNKLDEVNNFTEIFSIKTKAERFEQNYFARIDREVKRLRKEQEEKEKTISVDDVDSKGEERDKVAKPEKDYKIRETVSVNLRDISRGINVLESEEDVEQLVDNIRENLQKHIDEDKRIRLI